MEEECPALKGGDNYIIILRAMLEDSSHELRKRIAQRKAEIKEYGKALTPLGANRQPMTSLEWLHLPVNQVKPEHIEDFIADRVEHVEGSTVDRQLDLLSSIYNRASKGWRIHMDLSPMDGVKRPKYFNERDRRLKGDEELRLLEAARKEDQMASLEAHVEILAADEVAAARKLGSNYAVNKARKEAYERAKRKAIEEEVTRSGHAAARRRGQGCARHRRFRRDVRQSDRVSRPASPVRTAAVPYWFSEGEGSFRDGLLNCPSGTPCRRGFHAPSGARRSTRDYTSHHQLPLERPVYLKKLRNNRVALVESRYVR
jgi:hypothetical protein